ncbi:MAG TPA: hypothetical protein VKD71_03855 [Gemmataceae bacterium]|nr:hypothetical protein [Gemmataceae bacterium]
MRISYFSLDEVNQFLVGRWAGGRGFRVHRANCSPRVAGNADGTAIVLDLDYVTADSRAAWLQRVLTGEVTCPLLVHGHNISDAESADLRRRGAQVCRGRLRKTVVEGWLDGVMAGRSATCEGVGKGREVSGGFTTPAPSA